MSHTTTIKSVPIKDIAALHRAVETMQGMGIECELATNARPRMYYESQQVECDYVLKLKNCQYDVGFEKQEDGTYSPIYDEFCGYVANKLQHKMAKPKNSEEGHLAPIGILMQQYSRFSAINAAAASGYYVEAEEEDKDGNYVLTFAN